MDLQELIARGRFLFAGAPQRLAVFELVNGRRTARDIATETKRRATNVSDDLRALRDVELIQPRLNRNGEPVMKDGAQIFEKMPLARTIPLSYFRGPSKLPRRESPTRQAPRRARTRQAIGIPTESELLDICRHGEDQNYEFKGQGTEARKLAREVAAMLNTRDGGLILYGVDDDGTIEGSDVKRQKLDQPLQNALRNTVAPAPSIRLQSVRVIGSDVLVIQVHPWNQRDVYQYEGRVLLRKGTNVFTATPDEVRRLHRGDSII